MGRLETMFEDESITDSGVAIDEIVERVLDSDQIKRIITRMIKGELSERRLYEQVYDLIMDAESEIESLSD